MGVKEVIIGSLIWTILFLILFIPLTLLFIYKLCVIVYAKCFRQNLISITGADAMNVSGWKDDHYAFFSFGLVCQIEGEISVENVRTLFTQKFLGKGANNVPEYERFHCELVPFGGFPFLQRLNSININDHIYEKNLEGQILEDLLTDWLAVKYKKNSPCWEIIVVPLTLTGATALAIKIHHVLADAYSLVYVLDKLTNNTSSPYLVKDFQETFYQKVCQTLKAPYHLINMMRKSNIPAQIQNPYGDKGLAYMGFFRMDLNKLKQIRRKHNVHFASIILSILAGVLKKHLLDTNSNFPSSLRTAVTLAWPRHPTKLTNIAENQKLCNHFTVGFFDIHFADPDSDVSAVDRLLTIEKCYMDLQAKGLDKIVRRIMFPAMWLAPISLFPAPTDMNAGAIGYTMSVGGETSYEILGKRVNSIHNFQAMEGASPPITIATFAFSHGNNFDLTFTLKHCPDRETLQRIGKDYADDELQKLYSESFPGG